MSDITQIDGPSVRRKREALGLGVQDLATLACLSAKQIKQIEEGGMAAFYSENVKLTAARKVAALLHMTEDQLFGQVAPQPIETGVQALEPDLDAADGHEPDAHPSTQPLFASIPTQTQPAESAALLRSESWHVLAQPPEDLASHAPVASHATGGSPDDALHPTEQASAPEAKASDAPAQEPPQSQTHFLIKVLALFLVALAAAALLKQQSQDEKPSSAISEPPPPLMVNPPVGNEDNAAATGAAPSAATDRPTEGAPSATTAPAASAAATTAPAAAAAPTTTDKQNASRP